MKPDPDHHLSAPLANQEAALVSPLVVTEDLVARCASAIARMDRFTARPLTAEDQARAVLTYLVSTQKHEPDPYA